jgi:hypothetical protein
MLIDKNNIPEKETNMTQNKIKKEYNPDHDLAKDEKMAGFKGNFSLK